MCRLPKTEVKQGKFIKFKSHWRFILEKKTYKSQNINNISPVPKFTLGFTFFSA